MPTASQPWAPCSFSMFTEAEGSLEDVGSSNRGNERMRYSQAFIFHLASLSEAPLSAAAPDTTHDGELTFVCFSRHSVQSVPVEGVLLWAQ